MAHHPTDTAVPVALMPECAHPECACVSLALAHTAANLAIAELALSKGDIDVHMAAGREFHLMADGLADTLGYDIREGL